MVSMQNIIFWLLPSRWYLKTRCGVSLYEWYYLQKFDQVNIHDIVARRPGMVQLPTVEQLFKRIQTSDLQRSHNPMHMSRSMSSTALYLLKFWLSLSAVCKCAECPILNLYLPVLRLEPSLLAYRNLGCQCWSFHANRVTGTQISTWLRKCVCICALH